MANKRMFSKQITTSDAFVDMPTSSQLLYFHLNMEADDDGFVGNPKRVVKMVGANDDDLKVLIAKRFVLTFDSGILVIKHWKLHNKVRKDMYQETQYLEEKNTLQLKANKVYTELCNETVTEPVHRLDKIRLDQNRLDTASKESDKISIKKEILDSDSKEIPLIFKEFEVLNPSIKRMYGNKTQRQACKDLIKTYTFERVIHVIKEILPQIKGQPFFPDIATPYELFNKWSKLESSIVRYGKEKKIKNNVAF